MDARRFVLFCSTCMAERNSVERWGPSFWATARFRTLIIDDIVFGKKLTKLTNSPGALAMTCTHLGDICCSDRKSMNALETAKLIFTTALPN